MSTPSAAREQALVDDLRPPGRHPGGRLRRDRAVPRAVRRLCLAPRCRCRRPAADRPARQPCRSSPRPPRRPTWSSCSSSRPRRARAWTASAPRPRCTRGDLATDARWPRFAALRRRQRVHRGARAADAAAGGDHRRAQPVPPQPHGHELDELAIGQALADVATIAILSDRNTRERERLTEQLQAALTSRVIIEQAKGVLAERGQIPLDEAFSRLRAHARSTQQRLSDLARAVTDGSFDTAPLLR